MHWNMRYPEGWSEASVDAPGVAAVVVAPPAGGFRPNIVVTQASVTDMNFVEWQRQAEPLFAAELRDYLCVDLRRQTVGGVPDGVRRFATYSAETNDVAMVQYSALAEGIGWTVTASCDVLDLPVLVDVFESVVETFELTSTEAGS